MNVYACFLPSVKGPTTPAPACEDKMDNCQAYGEKVCKDPTYHGWAEDNCRYYCAGFAPGFCSGRYRRIHSF